MFFQGMGQAGRSTIAEMQRLSYITSSKLFLPSLPLGLSPYGSSPQGSVYGLPSQRKPTSGGS